MSKAKYIEKINGIISKVNDMQIMEQIYHYVINMTKELKRGVDYGSGKEKRQ